MASHDPEHPNVIAIVSDDQGAWALACAGNRDIFTPALDRLASEGTRLNNLFCTTPVCSPSRATLLTGELPSQHGIHDAIHRGESPDDPIEYLVGRETYVDVLADAGYDCTHIGKWHLGNSGRAQAGFTGWYALSVQGTGYQDPMVTRGGPAFREHGYTTDLLTDEAIAVIEKSADQAGPFMISLCYTAPHSPWIDQHPQDLLDLYEDCDFGSCPLEPEHPWSNGFRTADGTASRVSKHVDLAWDRPVDTLRGYFAAVTGMDRAIGRLIDRVDALGLRRSTVIIFLSDNGFSAGHHGVWGKGNGTSPVNMFESAIKVPGIVSQPGRIKDDVVIDRLTSVYDIRPTLLELAGVADSPGDARPGRSFAPELLGRSAAGATDEPVVVFDEYGATRMIRTKRWKLVHRFPHGPNELYDLENDPDERHNRVDLMMSSLALSLHEQLENWFHHWSDPHLDGTRWPVTGLGQIATLERNDTAISPENDGTFVQHRGEAPHQTK